VRVLAQPAGPREEVEEGQFHDDLYFRLNILEIHIPRCAATRGHSPAREHLIQAQSELKKHFKGARQT
jgi:transcriptional regulator with PAS, ATPase and Fis domain